MTIRVENLPLQSTEQDFVNLFAEYGDVKIISWDDGQGEVNLGNPEIEDSVIAKLNGIEFNGNKLLVFANTEESRGKDPTKHGTGK